MTVIFQQGDQYWIEYFKSPDQSIAGGGILFETATFEKPGGRLVAVSCTISGTVLDATLCIRHANNTTINYGDLILNTGNERIAIAIQNNEVGARTYGAHLVVHFRKAG